MFRVQAAFPLLVCMALAGPAHAATVYIPEPGSGSGPGPMTWVTPFVQPFVDWGNWLMSWFVHEEKTIAKEIRILDADLASFAAGVRRDVAMLDKLVDACGFKVTEVEVGMGLEPDVQLELEFKHRVSPGERQAVLKNTTSAGLVIGPVERILVDAMFAASDTVYAAGDSAGFGLKALRVNVGLIPHTSVVVGPKEDNAAH